MRIKKDGVMKKILVFFIISISLLFSSNEPIKNIEIGKNREIRINGKCFFPLMLWLQSDTRIPDGLSIGVNTFMGNGGKLSEKEYVEKLKEAGLYGIVRFTPELVGHDNLLGWYIEDEPDLDKKVYDSTIIPGKTLKLNPRTPLERILDGDISSWSVLDPLQDAELTIKFKNELEIREIGISLTISKGLSVAKDVVFIADGTKEILKATLEEKKGLQRFPLKEPVKLSSLTFKVLSIYQHENEYGSIGEIIGYDKDGNNLFLSPPRIVQRIPPEEWAKKYNEVKEKDKTRPIFLTLTASFMDEFTRWDEETKKKIYPEYAKNCDVIGFDVYPIFGWNKIEWIDYVARGTKKLCQLAGNKPVFVWIETNKGSRWVSPERQKDVLPQHTRAEVWMAIIEGATGIGYFTHSWVPSYKQFAPTEEMRKELKRLNEQITKLTEVILSDPYEGKIEMVNENNLKCHFKATKKNGEIWIFAQNLEYEKEGNFEIKIEGINKGKVEVYDEDREIEIVDGKFKDYFKSLAEHIYRIRK
ncbi:MAG: hypothetical protein NC827_08270 [Candidatus Omnitrophica bacterium]|nr:hypothetical protein [Candidatus Omnitrophota bacterium]